MGVTLTANCEVLLHIPLAHPLTMNIGLGVMGYPMACNLRSKMDSKHTLVVCDVSEAAIAQFRKEMAGKGPIEVVKTGAEAVKAAVSRSRC